MKVQTLAILASAVLLFQCNASVSQKHLSGPGTEHSNGQNSLPLGPRTRQSAVQTRDIIVAIEDVEETQNTISTNNTASPCERLNDCNSHGECIDGSCVCHKGYGNIEFGREIDCADYTLNECATQCYGHGECVPTNYGTFECVCHFGFRGTDCNLYMGCEELDFCSGHGTCSRTITNPVLTGPSHTCDCDRGFRGNLCEIKDDMCANSCQGRGTCTVPFHDTDSRVCECDNGFTDVDCGVAEPTCEASCSGFGTCVNGSCNCRPFAQGRNCANITRLCPHGCGHGFCNAQGQCECQGPYSGPRCNIYDRSLDAHCSDLNFCSGYGVCVSEAGIYRCVCFDGYDGSLCTQVEANEDCPNYCSGNGRCVVVPSPRCECDGGWFGTDCSTSGCRLDPKGHVCSGHGLCDFITGQWACTCDPGFKHGPLRMCEVEICPNECSGHGICRDDACVCDLGYSSANCSRPVPARSATHRNSTLTEDARDQDLAIVPVPCLNNCDGHGLCVNGECRCLPEYSGLDCSLPEAQPDDGAGDLEGLP